VTPHPPAARARAFLALPCGAELGRALFGAAVGALGGEAPARRAYRLPRAEGLHATLFFLGDVERERLEGLWSAVRAELAGAAAPALVVDRAGAFPERGRERVLWLGLREETQGRLAALHRGTLAAVRRAGFDTAGEERRPYRPHVTVARPRRPGTRVPDAFYELVPGIAWTAGEVALLESVRAETGPPVYEALERLALARG